MKKSNVTTLVIILAVVIFAFVILTKKTTGVTDEVAKCIGGKSTLYVQAGCIHCANQEKLFGSSYQFLKKIDCVYEPSMRSAISGTPTWVINGQQHTGVQSISKLKELTGCYD